jgi:C-terminal binding protein
MFRIAITNYLGAPATIEQEALRGVATVDCLEAEHEGELDERFETADGLIVFHEITLSVSSLERLQRCRVLVRCGVGFDNVDLATAGRKGIYVCNVPDYGVDEVADHAIGLAIACARKIVYVDRRLRNSLEPWGYLAVAPLWRLTGATMGIIGLGRIGTATALRAKALRMNVIACDPYIPDGRDKALGVRMAGLDELLGESDVVSLHVPLTEETRGMIGPDPLAKMKRTAFLVNTARGAVVDTDALAAALETGRIAGAGIDVLPHEPPSLNDRLLRLWRSEANPPPNLVITPHSAFYSEEGLVEMRTKAALEVRRVLEGQRPRNCVNWEYLTARR